MPEFQELPPHKRNYSADVDQFYTLLIAALPDFLGYMARYCKAEPIWPLRVLVREGATVRLTERRRPVYRELDWPNRQDMRRQHSVSALCDFIWLNGLCRMAFTKNTREVWEGHVLHLTERLICRALEREACREAAAGGPIKPFYLSKESEDLLASFIIDLFVFDRVSYSAAVPLFWFEGEPGKAFELADGVHIRTPRLEDVSFYLSLYDPPSNTLGGAPWWSKMALLTVNESLRYTHQDATDLCRSDGTPGRGVARLALQRVDLCKWAIGMAGMHPPALPAEGVVSVGDALSGGFNGLGRAAHVTRALFYDEGFSGRKVDLTEAFVADARKMLSLGAKYVDVSDDIRASIKYLGRSATATTEENRLLDAAIGLERILVNNYTELGFRFQLVGACLLGTSTKSPHEVMKELKDVYGARGGAAHGKHRGDAKQLSWRAQEQLAEVIYRVILLMENGQLRSSQPLAEQLLELLKSQLPILLNYRDDDCSG